MTELNEELQSKGKGMQRSKILYSESQLELAKERELVEMLRKELADQKMQKHVPLESDAFELEAANDQNLDDNGYDHENEETIIDDTDGENDGFETKHRLVIENIDVRNDALTEVVADEVGPEEKREDSPSTFIAAFDFEPDPNDRNQIHLIAGDELVDVKNLGQGWSKGTKSRNLQRGVFPTAFVLPVEELLPAALATDLNVKAMVSSLKGHAPQYSSSDPSTTKKNQSHPQVQSIKGFERSPEPKLNTNQLRLKPLLRPAKKEATTPGKSRKV